MIGEATLESRTAARTAPSDDIFLELVDEYGSALRRLTGAYVGRPADQEDLFQEIAIALWRAVPGFRGESTRRTWLYRIAHNVAISYSVKLRRHGQAEEPIEESFDPASGEANAEYQLLESEKLRLLNAAIRELAPIDRQIVLLHLEGLSYQEIEEIAGISQTAIATRLTRAREKLRSKIHKQQGGSK